MLRLAPAFVALIVSSTTIASAAPPALDVAKIEQLTGAKGKLDEKENVFKVTVPRTDLSVRTAGIKLSPPQGLASWAAFTRSGGHVMVMGDLCLTEDQVNPVMSAALEAGLDVTALHNHFFWESPRLMYMHIGGMGDEAQLAGAVGKVFAAMKEKPTPQRSIDLDPSKTKLDPAKIDAILGHKGELSGGVYKVVIGRVTRMEGAEVGKTMGVNTWAAFAGSDEQAVVDGDFAMLEGELQGVLKALRKGGLDVVAIHQHMTMEQPRMMFLHYFGVGPTQKLAGALKDALGVLKR
jgi:hypothetical protein